jgi:hypothetical protein
MWSRIATRLVMGALVFAVGITAEVLAEQRGKLEMRLSGSVAMAPAVLRSTVFVEQHPDNRMLRVSIDGENYFGSSDIPLEGADSKRSHFLEWKGLPAGEYQVSTELFGTSGERAVLVRRFTVVGN